MKDAAIVPLFNQLRALNLRKGEYESSAEFEARAGAALERASSTSRGSIAVTAELSTSYDADRQVIKVHSAILWNKPFGYRSLVTEAYDIPDYELMPVRTSEGTAGSYTGSNAFGATRQVKVVRGEEYGVALTDLKRSGTRGSWYEWKDSIDIPMNPDRAKATRSKLGLRVVGEIVPPGAIWGVSGDSPTMRRPVDRTITMRYVTIRSQCAAIVAMDNNELLRRLR
jgi:hypothetical protein